MTYYLLITYKDEVLGYAVESDTIQDAIRMASIILRWGAGGTLTSVSTKPTRGVKYERLV